MSELATRPGELIAVEQPADRNPALVYLAGLRAGPGRRTMTTALNEIAALVQPGLDLASFPWASLRFQHTAAIRSRLADRYAPATANRMLAALKGALKAAWRLGLVGAEDYQRAVDIAPVRGQTVLRGRALNDNEMRALFAVCAADPTPAGQRDAAMLAVMHGSGLRRSEVVALDLADYDADEQSLFVRDGKGGKDRIAYLNGGSQSALDAWVSWRGRAAGPLFQPLTRSHRAAGRRMTAAAVYKVLQERADRAGVRAFSPHDLRRTCISNLLDAGVDMATVQQLAGHASVTTTARYDRRGERAKRRAAAQVTTPYGGR